MAQRSQSPDGRPGRRGDSTHPPRTRRGGDRVPYPGARIRDTGPCGRATSRPKGRSTASRSRAAAPIPATVWACGPEPIDPHERWPVPIVEALTTAFTEPGEYVLLVAVDTASTAAARETLRALKRTADTVALPPRADTSTARSRPFWTNLVTDSATPNGTLSEPPADSGHEGAGAPERSASQRADLVLASLPAHAPEEVSLEELALLAADRLRCGGTLAVYTHSDWTEGRLVDPTGLIVAAAQHADLLYLQHIVTMHTPARDGRLHAAPMPSTAAEYARAKHRATARGLPAPHLRANGDVLVFAQPRESAAAPPTAGGEPDEDRS